MVAILIGPNVAAGRLAQWAYGWWWHWREGAAARAALTAANCRRIAN